MGIANSGRGIIRVKVEKGDLENLRPYLSAADHIELDRTIGANEKGVIKAKKMASEKVQKESKEEWEEAVRNESQISLLLISINNESKFDLLVQSLQPRVDIDSFFYNPIQSMGFIEIKGEANKLKRMIESLADIHQFQVKE